MKRRFCLILVIVILVILGAAAILLRQGYLLPVWVAWSEKSIDSKTEDLKIELKNRGVSVVKDQKTVWKTERGIYVQDVLWEDIDHDGSNELMILCWKRGRYGDSRPFWVENDEKNWSQHIFLYDWSGETMRPIWMASDLGMEVEAWSFTNHTRLLLTDREGNRSAWDWISWGLSSVEPTSLRFGALGDNLIHRQIYDYAFRHFNGNFDSLFSTMQEELSQYEVLSINQETVFVDKPENYSDYPRFGTPIQVGEALVRAGFDIVSCATNHAMDQGVEAVDLTAEFFERNGVLSPGIQPRSDRKYLPYEILEKKGIRCALFCYTQSTNGIPLPEETPYVLHTLTDEQQVRKDLADGYADSDICIVYVHWGTEYDDAPDETQKYWAQLFADSGVDVVIGTHPHVLQPVEWVTGKNGNETLVFYSLGNYISAQTEVACRTGGLGYFTVVKENGVCQITAYGLKELVTVEENGFYTTKLKQSENGF